MIFETEDAWLVQYLVCDILECCDEILAEEKNDFDDGQMHAFLYFLHLVQNTIDEKDRKEFNLDFDIDAKYRR